MVRLANLRGIRGAAPLHMLGPSSSPVPPESKGAIIIRDDGVRDKINLRCRHDNALILKNLARVAAASLPTKPGGYIASGARAVARIGPDEWLILAEDGAAAEIIAILDNPEAGHIALTNVSDALGSITIEGVHVRDMLAKHCALDFHAHAFTPMMAQTSLLSHAGVTIICLDENAFRIIGRSSFMEYIARLMMDAAIEYGYEYIPA